MTTTDLTGIIAERLAADLNELELPDELAREVVEQYRQNAVREFTFYTTGGHAFHGTIFGWTDGTIELNPKDTTRYTTLRWAHVIGFSTDATEGEPA